MRTPHVPKAPHNINMVTSADIDYFSSCNDYDYDIAPATSSFGDEWVCSFGMWAPAR